MLENNNLIFKRNGNNIIAIDNGDILQGVLNKINDLSHH
jgi:hypothetical protein